jgi:hypothetical protein
MNLQMNFKDKTLLIKASKRYPRYLEWRIHYNPETYTGNNPKNNKYFYDNNEREIKDIEKFLEKVGITVEQLSSVGRICYVCKYEGLIEEFRVNDGCESLDICELCDCEDDLEYAEESDNYDAIFIRRRMDRIAAHRKENVRP